MELRGEGGGLRRSVLFFAPPSGSPRRTCSDAGWWGLTHCVPQRESVAIPPNEKRIQDGECLVTPLKAALCVEKSVVELRAYR